jgi:hypothetical protein
MRGVDGVFESEQRGALNERDLLRQVREGLGGKVQNAGTATGKTSHAPHYTFFRRVIGTVAHVSPRLRNH